MLGTLKMLLKKQGNCVKVFKGNSGVSQIRPKAKILKTRQNRSVSSFFRRKPIKRTLTASNT